MAANWPELYSHGSRTWEDISDTVKDAWNRYHAGAVETTKRNLPQDTAELHEENARGFKRLAEGRDPRASTPPPAQDPAVESTGGEGMYINKERP